MERISYLPAALAVFQYVMMYLSISSDSLVGLSGNDSWQRAWLLPLDPSAAAIFQCAIATFALRPDSRHFRRWRQLHSQYDDVRDEFSLPIRSPLLCFWNMSKRYMRLTSTRCAPQAQIKQFARHHNLALEQFVANSNHFFVPYMRRAQPGGLPQKLIVNLDSSKINDAAACSVARFVTFTASAFLYGIARTIFLWSYVSNRTALCTLVAFAELGRTILAWCQEASVMTYSNYYKAVDTWAVREPRVGPPWSSEQEIEFQKMVSRHLGRLYHAKILHAVARWLSLRVTRRRLYEGFATPEKEDFKSRNLLLLIDEEDSGSRKELLYVVEFCNIPETMFARLKSSLSGDDKGYPKPLRYLLFALGLPSLFVPLAFAFAHPSFWTKILYTLEQAIVIMLKYADFRDQSVNTSFSDAGYNDEWRMSIANEETVELAEAERQ